MSFNLEFSVSTNTPEPKKNAVLEIIATVGSMASLFTVLQLMIKDDLSRLIGIVLLSATALWYLTQRKLVNSTTAILIVLVTAMGLGLAASFLSQPGTLTGNI